jgi:beta-galactosidase
VRWGWWVNSPERFDPPLIGLASRDGKKTVALAFERAIWASSNTGDDRACFHLFPWFSRIEPGQSVTVRGRLYVLKGGAQEALKRFRKDFSELESKAPLGIQIPNSKPPMITGHLGLGETNAPGGRTLWADNISLYRDGKPWVPVMGEFHFSRYPSNEWRDALLKMKAGGIDIVATYVFWIHHEEVRGHYDWSGQRSLRQFLELCHELGLYAFVRMGPWSHGEVRNGGFPDWLQKPDQKATGDPSTASVAPGAMGVLQLVSKDKLRTADPDFLKLVRVHYREIFAQMKGLLWKDGGPVVAVQFDNESNDLPYLFALKRVARELGVDVPFYCMTGWGRSLPTEELIPLYGGYADGFWTDNPRDFLDAFDFTPVRSHVDKDNRILHRFPYACCEIGGGMVSSYANRIHTTERDTEALALVKLGSGNNCPGYYMYQGGQNPEGRLTTLNESKASGYPNDLPVKDYDFTAPLGAFGQVRERYHRLRLQHLFLRDFGDQIARMPAIFPERGPVSPDEAEPLRWSVRSDGVRGFLFFNNHHRTASWPARKGVQFALHFDSGTQLVPRKPLDIPAGACGFWPVNLDCAGVRLDYAAAQLISRLEVAGEHWIFFAANEGIKPEFAFAGEKPRRCEPGLGIALTRKNSDGAKVNFVVLSSDHGRQFWKVPLAARDRVVLSSNALLPDSENQIRLENLGGEAPKFAVFPELPGVRHEARAVPGRKRGVFTEYALPKPAMPREHIQALPVKTAVLRGAKAPNAMDESVWTDAPAWRIRLPEAWRQRDTLLRIHFVGDVARLYVGGKLAADKFYNGQPFDFALWRIPSGQLDTVELRVMPLRPSSAAKLPAYMLLSPPLSAPCAELKQIEVLPRQHLSIELEKVLR